MTTMISVPLARALRTAGLRWKPLSGDRFLIDQDETGDDVFTVSEMTIEAHAYATGTVLGFNGTTEWALDSVSVDDALWLPSETQMREILRGSFVAMRSSGGETPEYTVDIVFRGEARSFTAPTAEDAYGEAVLHLVGSATIL